MIKYKSNHCANVQLIDYLATLEIIYGYAFLCLVKCDVLVVVPNSVVKLSTSVTFWDLIEHELKEKGPRKSHRLKDMMRVRITE